MTPFTDEEAMELLRENGALLAAKLGMVKLEDPTELRDKQSVLLVTNDNIILGKTFFREMWSEIDYYRLLALRCADSQDIYGHIYEQQFHRAPDGSLQLAETTIHAPNSFAIYVGD